MGQETVKNEYGEKIHIKWDESEILVHHTDCTDDYITIEELCSKYILSLEERDLIYTVLEKNNLITDENNE